MCIAEVNDKLQIIKYLYSTIIDHVPKHQGQGHKLYGYNMYNEIKSSFCSLDSNIILYDLLNKFIVFHKVQFIFIDTI